MIGCGKLILEGDSVETTCGLENEVDLPSLCSVCECRELARTLRLMENWEQTPALQKVVQIGLRRARAIEEVLSRLEKLTNEDWHAVEAMLMSAASPRAVIDPNWHELSQSARIARLVENALKELRLLRRAEK